MKIILTLALTIPLLAGLATAEEERCADLGGNCVCSEPLNTTSKSTNGQFVNPGDSTTKECTGDAGTGYAWYRNDHLAIVDEAGMPTRNDVDTVWENTSRGGTEFIFGANPSSNVRRICVRHYFTFDEDYTDPGPSEDCNNKMVQIGWDRARGVAAAQPAGASQWNLVAFGCPACPFNLEWSGTLTPADCETGWCRVEICLDSPDYDLDDGESVYGEGYFAGVTGDGAGKRIDFDRTLLGDISTPHGGFSASWVANMYREGSCTADTSRYISHAMMAGWDTADDQWINESSEVEGCVEDLLCDANGDSVVDMLDFIIMSQEWGMTGENLLSDCNGDNTVEFADYIILSTEWGESECNW